MVIFGSFLGSITLGVFKSKLCPVFPHVLEIGIIFLNSMSKIMPVGLAESELYIFEGKGRTHVAFHSRIYTRQP